MIGTYRISSGNRWLLEFFGGVFLLKSSSCTKQNNWVNMQTWVIEMSTLKSYIYSIYDQLSRSKTAAVRRVTVLNLYILYTY